MKEEDRKKRFVELLETLLTECKGVKGHLAQKLNIKPSTLTRWLQGKIDPANIDLTVFADLSKAAKLSTNELAMALGVVDNSKDLVLERFTKLVTELSSNQSQKQLAEKLGVSNNTISNWINSQTTIDPRRMYIGTLATLAKEKGWTLEELLLYLGLIGKNEGGQDWLSKFQTQLTQLPLSTQIKLITWLLDEFKNRINRINIEKEPFTQLLSEKNLSERTIYILLDKEDLNLASRYASNLVLYCKVNPDKIEISTDSILNKTVANFDLIIFDITESYSSNISLIQDVNFNGDIVVFASADLSIEARSTLEEKVTDLVIKPLNWQQLKDKEYFK